MKRLQLRNASILAVVSIGIACVIVSMRRSRSGGESVVYTVGDITTVHATVRVGTRQARRIADGDAIETSADGRARMRLDDGTIVAISGSTRLTVEGNRLSLDSGRIFVQGGVTPRTTIVLANAATTVSSSAVAFERTERGASVYCASGDVVLNAGSRRIRIESGETGTLSAAGVKVSPEKAFDDWTGGLAVPWGGPLDDRSAIPVIRASADGADPGTPLVVRSHRVNVEIRGEVAVTRARTTYFNGSYAAARAQVRFALPSGAILTRVARRSGSMNSDEEAKLVVVAGPSRTCPGRYSGVEWAGAGWLQGDLGAVGAGDTIELALEYTEWLPIRDGRATYRYPMAGGDDAGIIGELDVSIDGDSETRFLSVNGGASVRGDAVRYRSSDVRPAGDLVVEFLPRVVRARTARAYVMSSSQNDDPYVMVRAEVPEKPDPSMALVLLVDTSMSMGTDLDTSRAVVNAILDRLDSRDSTVVLAADDTVRPVGASVFKPVDARLRSEIKKGLDALEVGGASDIGTALERAVDILDSPMRGDRAGSGMIVYVGDGRPSIGESNAEEIRHFLARRPGGMPRLGTVAVGTDADRWFLAHLVADAGSMQEVLDTAGAARAANVLLAASLEPVFGDVDFDLGLSVDRVYPRAAHSAVAGSTIAVVGRLRGELPKRVRLRFHDGPRIVEDSRMLERVPLARGADLPARWATARVEEIAARGEGIEPAILSAAQAKLSTPWTSWLFSEPGADQSSVPFADRVLDLSPIDDAAFGGHVDTVVHTGAALLESVRPGGGVSVEEAAEIAIRRVLERARGAVRACRDARASVRPDIEHTFTITLSVDAEGHATRTRVVGGEATARDPVLERCVRSVVESLPFFARGVPVTVSHTLTVPEKRDSRRTRCSDTSRVALPIRKSIWRARAKWDADAYLAAAQSCELPTWNDRRAFLLLAVENAKDAVTRLDIAAAFDDAGEADAAKFVREQTLRRVSSFTELERLRLLLMQDEPIIDAELDKAYKKARSDSERLAVVRRFLLLSPHDALARRQLLDLLLALGDTDALTQEIDALRREPFVDAGLLARAASALRRIGRQDEARRVFGELAERAPGDPWALAYVGDRLRAEGMFSEAVTVYETLARLQPNDAGVWLRLALAHGGAGRVDAASRLLDRAAQTGGREDDGRLGELAAITEAWLLAEARGGAFDPEVSAELERRLLRTPLPDVAAIVIVQSPPSDAPVAVSTLREQGERQAQRADLEAPALGISAVRVERDSGPTHIVLSRAPDGGSSAPIRARVAALILDPNRAASHLVTRDVDVQAGAKPVEVRFDGRTLL